MIIPVRCMTCGSVIGSKYRKYQETVAKTQSTNKNNLITADTSDLKERTAEAIALDVVGVSRYCCRRHLLTHTDTIDLL
jgi:DNA-directed RNA polymerase I, II, and III subunit RPABC5